MNPDEAHPDEPGSEILEAEWARDQVLQLFADLAAGTGVQLVQLRTPQADATVPLAEAEAAFASNRAEAVQIRYLFEGESWCDTIMPGDPTTKIIRTRLPSL